MPHVKDFEDIYEDALNVPKSPGELNAYITAACKKYLLDDIMDYGRMNDVLGALEGAKLEFYRLVVATYEDRKIKGERQCLEVVRR